MRGLAMGTQVTTAMADDQACENTDREIWREREGDFYADSIHVTKGGGIGINCGGYVFVKPIREWFDLAGGKKSFDVLNIHKHGEQEKVT